MSDPLVNDPLDCSEIMYKDVPDWQHKNKSEKTKRELSRRGKALTEGQKRPFEDKYDFALRTIENALLLNVNWVINYSGGKDSTILSHIIVEKMNRNIPHVTSNTRLEYPFVIRNIKKWEKEFLKPRKIPLYIIYPEIRPKELWEKEGVPLWSKGISGKYRKYKNSGKDHYLTLVPKQFRELFQTLVKQDIKISDRCCDYLKKKPLEKFCKQQGFNGHFLGMRCIESNNRRLTHIRRGALFPDQYGIYFCHPLAHWLKQDVYHYLEINSIELEDETDGSGCVCCMFGCHLESPNKLQILKERNFKMYQTVLNEWGYKPVLDAAGVQY